MENVTPWKGCGWDTLYFHCVVGLLAIGSISIVPVLCGLPWVKVVALLRVWTTRLMMRRFRTRGAPLFVLLARKVRSIVGGQFVLLLVTATSSAPFACVVESRIRMGLGPR